MTKPQIDSYVGKKVKALRINAGFSQVEAGLIINASKVSIYNIERGKFGLNANQLYLLACAFNCNVSAFFPVSRKVSKEIIAN